MDSDLQELENELREFAPSPMSGEVLSRMVRAMERWEENADGVDEAAEVGKIVDFPSEKKSRSSWKPMWGAAAAVAILGASLGFLVPPKLSENVVTASSVEAVPVLRQASLVPVNVQRKISSVNTGQVADKDGLEYQVIQVIRREEADFRGDDNVGLKITRPKVDNYLVPVSY